ncbi:MAG: cytochrome c maturation protein CcmE [Gemmatimonadetes bacterium]|nr:cytochrome c maturation protein CcmE [Gemmatimonadota bacterium]
MQPRIKFLLGGAVVLGAAGVLMVGSIKDTAVYFLTPAELQAKVVADPGIRETGVKIGARVVHGSVERDSSGKRVVFDVTDGKATYKVDYRGLIPDTFSDSVDVVVEGRLGADGVFHATTLLAKCASRYEAAPKGYKPEMRAAYKAAGQAAPASTPSAAPTAPAAKPPE